MIRTAVVLLSIISAINGDRNKPCLEAKIECPEVDGEYPVYSSLPNCTQFCQCSNGAPYLHDCPPQLHFNPNLNVCDHPENAWCKPPEEPDPCSKANIECPEVCGDKPIYAPLENCSQFCECYNGKLILQVCPSGLHFNSNLGLCDIPTNAGCQDSEGEEDDGSGDKSNEEEDNNEDNPCIEAGVECPKVDGKDSVYAPLPNCSQFCQCSNGKPYKHDCPPTLHFNPVLNVCDYPERAGCAGGNGSGENGGNSDENNNGGGENNNSTEDDGAITEPSTSGEENNDNNPCIEAGVECPKVDGKDSVYAPLPNCSQFCQCSNGKPYKHDCPPTLHFNPVLNVCDYPERAGCAGGNGSGENGGNSDENNNGGGENNNSTEDGGAITEPSTSGEENNDNNPCIEAGVECPKVDGKDSVYAPLPNCSQFCQCSNGKPYKHDCPPTLHFNPVLNVCDYPERAGCAGGNGSGENGGNSDENNNGGGENNNSTEDDGAITEPSTSGEENNDNNPCIEAGVECPKVDGKDSVYAPLPNCSQFCQCSNGKPYKHDCPPTLHFNPVLNVCDYPERAGCAGGNGSGENGGNSDENNNGGGENNNSTEDDGAITEPSTSGEENNDNNPCIEAGVECPKVDGKDSVYAPLPNCSQFCQCSNGKPYKHDCPPTLHFNPVLNVCDYPERAGCAGGNGSGENGGNSDENNNGGGENNNSTEDGGAITEPSTSGEENNDNNPCIEAGVECPKVDGKDSVYAPLPNCSQFCQCSNGKPYKHDCPPTLHFNPVLNVCDYPERAGCAGGNGSGENGGNSDENNNGGGENNNSTEDDGAITEPSTSGEENNDNNPCIEAGVECPKVDGKDSVYAPLPNCSQFCQCSNGKPYKHDCPPTLHFNPVLNVCDYPERAGCAGGNGSGENGGNSDENNNGGGENNNSTEDGGAITEPSTSGEENNDNNPCIEAGVECPKVDGKDSVYAPLPNCSQFCQCSNGKPYKHDCPPTLHFNPVLNVCDYPERAGCAGGNGSGENGGNSDENNNGGGENNNSTEDDGAITEPSTSGEENNDNNPCIEAGVECPKVDGKDSVYAPLPNCSQFCQCSNGKPYKHDCPPTLHFNPVLNVCDYPERAGCAGGNGSGENGGNSDENNNEGGENNNSTEDDGAITEPSTSGEENNDNNPCIEAGVECPKVDGKDSVYAPLPNCSQFCQCSNGKPYKHDCPPTLHFNPVLNVCDYPERAGCAGGNGSGENGGNSDENNNGGGENNNSTEDGGAITEPSTSGEENNDNNPCIEAGVECPKVDGKDSVYAPLPNCSQFCQCSNGKPYKHDCPPTLHFNPVLNVCDYPERAGCAGGNGSGENGGNSDENNNGGGENNNSTEDGGAITEPSTSGEENNDNNPCIEAGVECPKVDGKDSVYAPLPNCSQFCQCSNGKPYKHDCPPTLHFNPVLNVCDYPERAGCAGGNGSGENGGNSDENNNGGGENNNSTEDGGAITEPSTSGEENNDNNPCIEAGVECPKVDGKDSVYAPLPNCSQFCQCSNGKPYQHDCPPTLHFNPVLNVCDYPERAGCAGGNGSGENGGNSDENNNGGGENNNSTEDGGAITEPSTSGEENNDNNPCIEAGVECPKVDGKDSVYAPLPNCSQFCQCSNGKPYKHDCPPTLHFNPVLNVCDYPERAGCAGGNDSGENGGNSDENNNGGGENNNSTEDGGAITEPSTSGEENNDNNPCIEAGVECPKVDGKDSVYAPLPNCSQFCQCSNGKPYKHDCPPTLHFNPVLNVCDYPERAGCAGGNGSGENGGNSDENNNGGGENNNSTEDDGAITEPSTSGEENNDNNPCIEAGVECPKVDGKDSVYAPLPNCSQFCQCSNGKPYKHDCPPTLHFNPVLNVCDYPERAGCAGGNGSGENGGNSDENNNGGGENNNSTEDDGAITEPSTSGEENNDNNPCIEAGVECPKVDGKDSVYAPLPNCSQFCQCSNGKPYKHDCPPTLHFNPVLNVCDYPERAGCAGGNGSGENGGNSDENNNGGGENNNSTEDDGAITEPSTSGEENNDNNPCIEAGVECPKVDGKDSVYAPLPNCSQFCQCSNGKPYKHDCPPTLHFNPVLNVCDYPERAGCAGGNGSGENGGNSDENNNGGGENNNSTEDDGAITEPSTSGEENNDNNPCIEAGVECPKVDGKDSVYAPLPNCSQFCQCSNGKPYKHDCPPTLHFNPVLNVCDYPERAGCAGGNGSGENGGNSDENNNGGGENNNSTEDDGAITEPSTSGEENNDNNPCIEAGVECPKVDGKDSVYAPLPNCSQFCQCSNGKPYQHDCPPTLHFNPVLNVCDYPERAGCAGGNGSGENGGTDGGNGETEEDNGSEENDGENNSNENDNDNNSSSEGNGNGDNTEVDDENQPCLESNIECPKIDGEYPVYGPLPDCTQFCQCSNGLPYLHNCSAGLHFNPVLNVCDYPHEAGCANAGGSKEDSNENDGGNEGSNENENENGGDKGSDEENNNDIDNENKPCLDSNIECPKIDGEYPVYGRLPDCTQFCQCSNGLPYLHNCSAGLHFNPVLNVCDYPHEAGCANAGGSKEDSNENDGGHGDSEENSNEADSGSEESNETIDNGSGNLCLQSNIECPKVDGAYPVYAPLSDCTKFCQCSHGVPYLFDCPSGLHFNPQLNVCDWPQNARCNAN